MFHFVNSFLLIETSNIDILSNTILDIEHPKDSIHTHTQLLELLHKLVSCRIQINIQKISLHLYILMMNYLKRN